MQDVATVLAFVLSTLVFMLADGWMRGMWWPLAELPYQVGAWAAFFAPTATLAAIAGVVVASITLRIARTCGYSSSLLRGSVTTACVITAAALLYGPYAFAFVFPGPLLFSAIVGGVVAAWRRSGPLSRPPEPTAESLERRESSRSSPRS
jgi:hypothetical protein